MSKFKTVNAVVEDFINRYPDLLVGLATDLTQNEFVTKFHLSIGAQIRNDYELWGNNQALLDDCKVTSPDEASSVILKALWKRLQVF